MELYWAGTRTYREPETYGYEVDAQDRDACIRETARRRNEGCRIRLT
jgi:hypothetical protein